MAVSLNSVVGFNAKAGYHNVSRSGIRTSLLKVNHFTYPLGMVGLRKFMKGKKGGLCLLVADGDHIATDTSDESSGNAERAYSDATSSAVNLPLSDSQTRDSQFQSSTEMESGSQNPEVSNGSITSSDLKQNTSTADIKSTPKRSPLTAREKLRAARVLSRYSESKASKSELGSKVLEALRESDRGKKRSRLPEAPTNLLDDSKRGMPKAGLTFEFPGGVDMFVIIFSFVFISTVMFATTFIVWKVGAIHFNEY
ncbi:hypothetical protein F0562_031567 [Nyssa sinensis]|uniref:Uncharacterized protein n=1 Tax=Nyssa sinensis TaxID=561372 RepID=A0A5J5AUA4_9ASTE|nr:hypothetical protein F0562_031567 [Nyssa sinensis]